MAERTGLTEDELRTTLRGLVKEYGLQAVVDAALVQFQGVGGAGGGSVLPWKPGCGPMGPERGSGAGPERPLAEPSGLTCQTCRWFTPTTVVGQTAYGLCHLEPTRMGVEADWWCRELTPRSVAQAMDAMYGPNATEKRPVLRGTFDPML